MIEVGTRAAGVVIPFTATHPRRARPAAANAQARGEILLFTGVRYERMPEPNPEPPALVGQSGAGRRRRRS